MLNPDSFILTRSMLIIAPLVLVVMVVMATMIVTTKTANAQTCYANGTVVTCPTGVDSGCWEMSATGGDPYRIACPSEKTEEVNFILYNNWTEERCSELANIPIPENVTDEQRQAIRLLQKDGDEKMNVCLNTINADPGACKPGETGEACVKTIPIFETFLQIVNLLAVGAGLFITTMIAFRGIQYSTARGDPQRVAEARNGIIQALIALLLYFFMYALLQWLIPGGMF